MSLIHLENLTKHFKILNRREGLAGAFRDLFSGDYRTVEAVAGISFNIEPGEIVGYIGPNGAGKSTTIKMMTGILKPSGGIITVNGRVPYDNRIRQAQIMGVVFGQRTQLWWDLPVIESFKILKEIYRVDQKTFDHSVRVASYVHAMADERSETGTYLRSQADFEHGSLKELFTAALFHDIGKTIIPKTILHDDHSRREWAKRANEWATDQGTDPHFDPEKIVTLDDTELDHYFMEAHHERGADPLDIVPIGEIFDPETIQRLAESGISTGSTFREVLKYHERATKAILRRAGMYVASDIASHHHDYDGSPIRLERYPTEVSALRLSFELSILRSMDVYDALTSSDREYLKKSYHPLIALEILIKDAEAEFTEPELTRRVVRDLYQHVETTGKHTPKTEAESRALEKVLAFIGEKA